MIIIRTKHDLATEYTYVWTEPIIAEAEKRGFRVVLVEGSDVNLNHFSQRINKVKPKFVMFNGHGFSTSFYDNQKRELINLETSFLLKETITFARACDCLNELGVKTVQEGCHAFIGYRKKFMIPRWHFQTCRPLKDPAAKPVLECSNQVVLELLKNKEVKEAVDKSHEQAEKLMDDLVYSEDPFAPAVLQAIVYNDSALGFVGNPKAKFN